MPRARSPNRDKARELWLQSEKKRLLKDIAAELGVSEEQVRKWKNQDAWNAAVQKVTLPKADNGNSNVTKQRGGQPGNQNAAGHGAPEGNHNSLKHGIYSKIYWDTLDEEEHQMVEAMSYQEETLLEDQIALLTVRERRLLRSIDENRKKCGGLALDNVIKRTLEIKGNVIKGRNQTQTETTTRTISTFEVVQKLEAELTRVQAKKTRCIEALNHLRIERQKLEGEQLGNEVVNDWVSAVLGGDADDKKDNE